MSARKIAAVLLIAGGVLVLVYGGFNYTRKEHDLKLGSLALAVERKERVHLPVWSGVAAIGAGALLLILAGDRKR